jgi:membrane associated rhomboid family serine protease
MSQKFQTEFDDPPEVLSIIDPPPLPPPTSYYTVVLIGAIGAVAVTQLVTGLEDSILVAGFVKPAFLQNHEYWRILTGAATHGSVLHVVMNCFAFFNIGRIFEMLANRAHLAIVFLLSAVGGGILSLAFMPDGTSVGASGGIVGLIGYLLIYAFRRKKFITSEFRKNLLINIGIMLVFGITLYQVIDNFGHIGGLITGVVYGFVQVPAEDHVDPREAGPATDFAGLAAVGSYIAVCLFSILLILRVV